MTPVLELKDLHVTLRQHRRATELVKGVSFAVGPGECLGILGESGSGKSMSMKAAMGLLDKGFSVSGTATFQGEALLEKSGEELRRLRGGRVGIVLQNPMTCFDPLYRVGDQIAESFAAHNSWSGEEIRRRSLELLEKMRIRSPEEVLEKYPHQLSGGMLQRAAAALLMALHPKYILADEPTSALDAENRTLLLELLEKQRETAGILFISHDVAALRALCGTVYVMEHGMLTEQGTMQELLEHPKQAWTKEYAEANRPASREGWTWTD